MVLSFKVPGNPELSVHLSVLKQDTSNHLHSRLGQPLGSVIFSELKFPKDSSDGSSQSLD